LTKFQSDRLNKLLQVYPKLFAEPNQKLTYTTNVRAEIRTSSDTPVYSKFYQYPMSLKDEVNKQVSELLNDGIIRPSRSPYNSPVWIVPKKADASGVKKISHGYRLQEIKLGYHCRQIPNPRNK